MSTFAVRLKELRKQAGLSQQGLADELGIASGTISVWERGARKPELGTIETLAARFDVTLAYLLGDSDDGAAHYGAATSEDRVGWLSDVDAEDVKNLAMQLARLSPDSRRIVSGAITEAFRFDRERGLLKPEEEIELSLHYVEWAE